MEMQEKNDKTPQKCFSRRGAMRAAYIRVDGHRIVHRFRQRDTLRLMSVSVRALEQAHTQVRAAIVHRRPIAALYRGRPRLLCPHLLGWNKHRRLQVLCYQYGGDSESGLKPAGASDNWRCLAVENLSDVDLLDGPCKQQRITRGPKPVSKKSNSMRMPSLNQFGPLNYLTRKVQNPRLAR